MQDKDITMAMYCNKLSFEYEKMIIYLRSMGIPMIIISCILFNHLKGVLNNGS